MNHSICRRMFWMLSTDDNETLTVDFADASTLLQEANL